MSKLSDYSKFDHLESDSDDETEEHKSDKKSVPTATIADPEPKSGPTLFRRHPNSKTRFILEHCGRYIYEWEQSLQEVTLYIPTPPEVSLASQIHCTIEPNRLRIGLRRDPNQFFLDEPTFGTVDVSNSTWTWENSLLTVELQKANKGIVWEAVGCGYPAVRLDPFLLEEEKQRLMLERWQEENPGMDFRGATFSGSAPDPRNFMGGVRYD